MTITTVPRVPHSFPRSIPLVLGSVGKKHNADDRLCSAVVIHNISLSSQGGVRHVCRDVIFPKLMIDGSLCVDAGDVRAIDLRFAFANCAFMTISLSLIGHPSVLALWTPCPWGIRVSAFSNTCTR